MQWMQCLPRRHSLHLIKENTLRQRSQNNPQNLLWLWISNFSSCCQWQRILQWLDWRLIWSNSFLISWCCTNQPGTSQHILPMVLWTNSKSCRTPWCMVYALYERRRTWNNRGKLGILKKRRMAWMGTFWAWVYNREHVKNVGVDKWSERKLRNSLIK